MKFIDLRKSNMGHLYFVYVYAREDDEKDVAYLYRLGAVMDIKRKMRDQHRKIDIVKVW